MISSGFPFVGTGYPPPQVLNLEPEGPQRFLEMYIQCVGTSIVISFFNKVAYDWIKKGSTVQVRLPSASSMVSGTTQQARIRGTIRRMLECGLQQVEMARAITELQYEAALSGYRQSYDSPMSLALSSTYSADQAIRKKGKI